MNIGDLISDPKNARKHNPRNVGMIEKSLGEVGTGRSIVIDENNVVLAGNATIEAAAAAGLTKLKTVDVDGETLVAVRRTGLTPQQKTRLSMFDNRTAELAEWDIDVLAELDPVGALDGLFAEDELAELLGRVGGGPPDAPEEFPEVDENIETNRLCPKCGYEWSQS